MEDEVVVSLPVPVKTRPRCRRVACCLCGVLYILALLAVLLLMASWLCSETGLCNSEHAIGYTVLLAFGFFVAVAIFACICSVLLIKN